MISKWQVKYEFTKNRDKLLRKIVWKLPKRVIMWSFIRVVSHATTGEYKNQIVPDLTAMDALKRWPSE